MFTKRYILCSLLVFAMPHITLAAETNAMSEHTDPIYHMFRLETDYGPGKHTQVKRWDADGWVGGDYNKLWLKSEGEISGDQTEQEEFWAMYSRNIATFWDAQAGVRYDIKPYSSTYLVLGFDGLAPYSFETEAHLFLSDDGDVSARIRERNDFLITQKLITQPYVEVNFAAQDVAKHDIGAGITDGNIGLQTRYEITRKFAPYIDVRYDRKLGETSAIAHQNGENTGDTTATIGLRLMF